MPRFTDKPLEPPPFPLPDLGLDIMVEGLLITHLPASDLSKLQFRAFESDFHCVTTWTVRGLVWTGVPLQEVLASVPLSVSPTKDPMLKYLVARSYDRRRAHFLTTDALADDVFVATHLNGEPLGPRHGGPLRLVAPRHYGYKSIKHLRGIDLTSTTPERLGKEHLRGRVVQEERHPRLPARVLRLPYRLLIAPTAFLAERSMAKSEASRE